LASLDEAINKAQQAKDKFVTDENKSLAQNAVDAAGIRKEVLEMNSTITSFDIAAMKSTLAIEYVFTMIIDADTEMRQAVEAVNNGGADAISESLEYNKRALEKLGSAEQAIAQTAIVFPEVNLQSLTDYLVAKKASAELAVASDQAFVDGDYETYRTRTDEFNAKDAEAVALAANIPEDPRTLVYTAYEEATVQLKLDYDTVRSAAADKDAYLRDYLGVTTEQATNDASNAAT
jgi:type II secretory pathway component GspD/PulD (secretin)